MCTEQEKWVLLIMSVVNVQRTCVVTYGQLFTLPIPSLSLSCFLGSKCPYFWLVDFMLAPFGFNLVGSARCWNWKYQRYILLSTLISGYIFDNDSCT